MKIRQTLQHFAAKQALTMPLVGDKVRAKLVDLHTRVFLERAPEERRGEREARLDAFFDATMDAYLAALDEGYTEAHAREITHIQANMEFARLGWTEMMEFPIDELEANVRRHESFFGDHEITLEEPLGAFHPDDALPQAPATPEKLDEPESPHAQTGYGDDLYVEDGEGRVQPGEPPSG